MLCRQIFHGDELRDIAQEEVHFVESCSITVAGFSLEISNTYQMLCILSVSYRFFFFWFSIEEYFFQAKTRPSQSTQADGPPLGGFPRALF